MSAIGSWAMAVISKSQLSLHHDNNQNHKREMGSQTMLSAGGTSELPNDWILANVNDIDFIANVCDEPDDDERVGKPERVRRKRIPDKPNQTLTLWSVFKDLIGQNITNVALPVNFNEPLTVLQRMTETFESSFLLDLAAECANVNDQIAYLAAFCIAGYAVSGERTGKPFNPLLGETYEFDRTSDLGWKCVTEQVSHHPSVSALHCESEKWVFWEDLRTDLLFRGKYIRVVPNDYRYVKFKSNEMTYRIERAETNIHNIIFGKVWIDHCGKVEIICLNNNTAKCNITFVPSSSFSRVVHRTVNGEVINSSKVKRLIRGNWNSKIEIAKNISDENDGELLASAASFETVWERKPPKPEAAKYYNFSEFASQLNESESFVAPTDSRRRPDVRLMEDGKWDEANELKLRLEDKQRQANCRRESDNASLLASGQSIVPYTPIWFVKMETPIAGIDHTTHIYKGEYWEAKRKGEWSMCPDIF